MILGQSCSWPQHVVRHPGHVLVRCSDGLALLENALLEVLGATPNLAETLEGRPWASDARAASDLVLEPLDVFSDPSSWLRISGTSGWTLEEAGLSNVRASP